MYQYLLSKFVYLIIECYNCSRFNLLSDLTNLWSYKYVEAIKTLTSAKSCLTILIFCKFPFFTVSYILKSNARYEWIKGK